jgi:iron complex transport system ATP-binding protein
VTEALGFSHVGFSYASGRVLSEVSFTLPTNGLMALVGPNGAGKSTLLRLAAGLLPAAQGDIRVCGRPVGAWQRRELARTVALVPQQLLVPFPFTVEQIVAQGRTPYKRWFGGLSPADKTAIERAMEFAGIAHLRTRVMTEISGGEHQKVKLAIALAQAAPLLLLDEPFQNLDIGSQSEFLELLLSLHRRGLTIVSALHDLPLVCAHFPLTLLLTNGADYAFGTTESVLTHESVTAAFNLAGRDVATPYLFGSRLVTHPRGAK